MDSCRRKSDNNVDNSGEGGGSDVENYHYDERYNRELDGVELSLLEIKVENRKSKIENQCIVGLPIMARGTNHVYHDSPRLVNSPHPPLFLLGDEKQPNVVHHHNLKNSY